MLSHLLHLLYFVNLVCFVSLADFATLILYARKSLVNCLHLFTACRGYIYMCLVCASCGIGLISFGFLLYILDTRKKESDGSFGIWVANKRIYVLFCVLFRILCTATLPSFMSLISLLLAMDNGPFCEAAIMI